MTNEKLVEYYGFKAHDVGKFMEWRNVSASLQESNPKAQKSDIAEMAYKMVVGSGEI